MQSFYALEYWNEIDSNVRNITDYDEYQKLKRGTSSLENLCLEFIGQSIQESTYNSLLNARASLFLYKIKEKEWES